MIYLEKSRINFVRIHGGVMRPRGEGRRDEYEISTFFWAENGKLYS